MATAAITGMKLIELICESLGIDPDQTSHIILDISADLAVKAYVEMVASPRILDIDWTELKAEIKIVDKDA